MEAARKRRDLEDMTALGGAELGAVREAGAA
jgi:hypothetical protein